jgi:hypothetical protein
VRAVSDRRRKRDAVYPQRRERVWERGNGMCEWCGMAAMTDCHHLAGRGGSDPHRVSGDWRDAENNLVGLDAECHRRVHAEPEWARSVGLMRSRHGKLA